MPFRRASRSAPRFHRKKRVSLRRSFRRKPMRRYGRKTMRPSTTKDKTIVSDRKFVNFKFVTVTNGTSTNDGTHYDLAPAANGYGMLPIASDTSISPAQQMFVFSPNYSSGTFTADECYALPGNGLALLESSAPFDYYSDAFKQTCPTGVIPWSNFYSEYICHGSSIDVTLVDSFVPGQLFVLPVPDNDSFAQYSFNYSNMINLTSFAAIPDEQAYCRIKLVAKTGGMDKVRIKHKMLTKKLFDVKNLHDSAGNRADLNPAASTIPNVPGENQWSWLVGFVPAMPIANLTLSTVMCTVQIKVTYHCELLERINLDYTPVPS